uniref:cytochrome c oxidase subunit III n=1 Tax=Anurida maritima TaxID=64695 RepID=UPI0022FD9F8C|nr:cytochrome c oxidase subunit III [Anurida maritima]WBK17670.1 cytochrome c oxidase subunit III [Anurida maritima]
MLIKSNHTFHMVDPSPWPILASFAAFTMVTGIVKWFTLTLSDLLYLGVLTLIFTTYQWWRDITREGTFQGLHTLYVGKGLRWGMILFIASEVLFFFSFFWAFFHNSLSPTLEVGLLWPPMGIIPFNATQVPLLNTLILLSSGITVTWAHHALMENNHTQMVQAIFLTVLLGVYFSLLQAVEYFEASFSIADSAYGTSFFVTTGFHGLHVLIGTTFLVVCMLRMMSGHFSSMHHFGFEAAAWYWHFVDVVWLLLYVNMYWWGS